MMTPGGVTPAPLRSAQLTVYLAVSYTHAGIAGHSKTERNDTEIGESLKTVSFGVMRCHPKSHRIISIMRRSYGSGEKSSRIKEAELASLRTWVTWPDTR